VIRATPLCAANRATTMFFLPIRPAWGIKPVWSRRKCSRRISSPRTSSR
jgi:hypothetical protein